MRRPKLETFIGFVRKYHNARHIGLKMLYRDFPPETDEDKDKLKRAWDVIAKEINNAPNGEGREGESQNGGTLRQGEGGESVLRQPEREENNGDALDPQEKEEVVSPKG